MRSSRKAGGRAGERKDWIKLFACVPERIGEQQHGWPPPPPPTGRQLSRLTGAFGQRFGRQMRPLANRQAGHVRGGRHETLALAPWRRRALVISTVRAAKAAASAHVDEKHGLVAAANLGPVAQASGVGARRRSEIRDSKAAGREMDEQTGTHEKHKHSANRDLAGRRIFVQTRSAARAWASKQI